MQAAPAIPVDLIADAAAPAAATPASAATATTAPRSDPSNSPWLYRSEGFAEDLDTDNGASPPEVPALWRWGLPLAALVGVVGLAAAFTLA